MAYKELLFYAKEEETKLLFSELEQNYPMEYICSPSSIESGVLISRNQFPFTYEIENPTEKEQLLMKMFRKYDSIMQMPTLNLYEEFSKYNGDKNPDIKNMFYTLILKGASLQISERVYEGDKTRYSISLREKDGIMMKLSYRHIYDEAERIYPHYFTIWQNKLNKQKSLDIYQALKNILDCKFLKKKEYKDIVYYSPKIVEEFRVVDLAYKSSSV